MTGPDASGSNHGSAAPRWRRALLGRSGWGLALRIALVPVALTVSLPLWLPLTIPLWLGVVGREIDADVRAERWDLSVLGGRLSLEGLTIAPRPGSSAPALTIARLEMQGPPLEVLKRRHLASVTATEPTLALDAGSLEDLTRRLGRFTDETLHKEEAFEPPFSIERFVVDRGAVDVARSGGAAPLRVAYDLALGRATSDRVDVTVRASAPGLFRRAEVKVWPEGGEAADGSLDRRVSVEVDGVDGRGLDGLLPGWLALKVSDGALRAAVEVRRGRSAEDGSWRVQGEASLLWTDGERVLARIERARIEIGPGGVGPNVVDLRRVEVDRPEVDVEVLADGPRVVAGGWEIDPSRMPRREAGGEGPRLRLDRLRVRAGTLACLVRSGARAFPFRLAPIDLFLHDVATGAEAPGALAWTIDAPGLWKAAGGHGPFGMAAGPQATLASTVLGLDATRLSDLTQALAEVEVQRGIVSLFTTLRLTGTRFRAKSRVRAHGLALAGRGADREIEAGRSLKALVKDLANDEGTIDRTVPIEGDMNDVRVPIGTLVADAVGQALGDAVGSVLAPIGRIFRLSGPRPLIPRHVPFAPGSAALAPEHAKGFSALASALSEKPDRALFVLARAGRAERAVLDEDALRDLAERRALEVAGALIEAGCEPSQVLIRPVELIEAPAGDVEVRPAP